MKNLFVNPNSLYLVDTKVVNLEGLLFNPKYRIYPKRKNVAVVAAFHHYFELENGKNRNWLGNILPTKANYEEYIDVKSICKFPYDSSFSSEKVTLETLRGVYRKYQLIEQKDLSPFNIQGLYVGDVQRCIVLGPNYVNTEVVEKNTILLKNQENRFITLENFLEGKNKYLSSTLEREKEEYVDTMFLREISLEEALSSIKGSEKHLQFSKRNI